MFVWTIVMERHKCNCVIKQTIYAAYIVGVSLAVAKWPIALQTLLGWPTGLSPLVSILKEDTAKGCIHPLEVAGVIVAPVLSTLSQCQQLRFTWTEPVMVQD